MRRRGRGGSGLSEETRRGLRSTCTTHSAGGWLLLLHLWLRLTDGLVNFCLCQALFHQKVFAILDRCCLHFGMRQKLNCALHLVIAEPTRLLST